MPELTEATVEEITTELLSRGDYAVIEAELGTGPVYDRATVTFADSIPNVRRQIDLLTAAREFLERP